MLPDEQLLALAKPIAVRFLREGDREVRRRFTGALSYKYKVPKRKVAFAKLCTCIQRVRSATLYTDCDAYGETDGSNIRISRSLPVSFPHIVSTLVHEALHYYTRVRGKCPSTAIEHALMVKLGEPESAL